ncbi:MAG: S9 family peptidase [Lachnospiraceae bacterium]|jgi:dipeptidyl aminopeptidase/acylaminoacyl peptidase|nr:S9 family peptidase [Lachnospiraceae bacterium]
MGEVKKLPVIREDLYQFHFVSDVSLSPDGGLAAYVVTQADKEENGYKSSLWVVDLSTGRNRKLAERGGAKSPVWLDSGRILFVSGRDKMEHEDKPCTRYYEISVNGGEASLYLTVPVKADKIRPIGDKLWLLSAVADENESKTREINQHARTWDEVAVRGKDYDIYEELPFRFNGKGVINRKRPVLYLFSEADSSLKRITPKFLETVSYDVSPDHKYVAFCGPVFDSIRRPESALYLYDVEAGTTRELVPADRHNTGHVCFMGNRRIFYTGSTRERMGKNPRFYTYDLDTDCVTSLPFHDMEIGSSVGSDARYGSGRSLRYSQETGHLYLTRTSWGDSSLMSMDTDGNLTQVSREAGAVTGFDVCTLADGTCRIVLSAMRGQHLVELYLLNPDDGSEKKLTSFNDNYLDTHTISAPESFRYMGKSGYEMEAYVIRPADYTPGKQYPAVFQIHGGPKGVSGSVFFHEFQCLASAGYFVFYGNPRGSDGRGEAYADITEVFGTDDFNDLMELFDEVLRHAPDIDETRVGACGGSYGGFMCNWMEGHTDRFAAIVSQRSISNYLTKCLYTDIGYYANWLQMGAYPWEDFDKIWSMSPLKEAVNGRTPLLLIQSDEDYRCWMDEAVQMFSAVKRQGVDTRMVLFHGENHELSRGGKPENRLSRLKELMGWFDKYLS